MSGSAEQIVHVHHAQVFVVFTVLGATCGIIALLWLMYGPRS